jgi:hypothetical protein
MIPDRETGPGPASSTWRDPVWPPAQPLPPLSPSVERTDTDKKKKKKDKKKGGVGSARGIETMFRTSYRTHIDMSSLADNKANIMVTVNSLVLSVTLASISTKIDANPWLLLPTALLLLTALVSLYYAIQAARPRVTNRPLSLEDVRQNRSNILFFGNFVHLREDEYLAGMTEILQDSDRLYINMLRDIYSLGGVLQQKFGLLRKSYNWFMYGVAAAVISFIIVLAAVVAFGPRPATIV